MDKDEKIKIKASKKSLSERVKVDLSHDLEKIYWYIKFNIPLDEKFANNKNMFVTDADGYIMKTDILYRGDKNSITIYPIDSYEQDKFYILTIDKKMRPKNGKGFKRNIYILFKLLNGKISQYKILDNSYKIPKPRKRDKNYENRMKAKVYSFQKKESKPEEPTDFLPLGNIRLNIIIGVVGLLALMAGLYTGRFPIIVLGGIVCVIGGIHLLIQWRDKTVKATFYYFFGALAFNRKKYEKAERHIKKAYEFDEKNELCEYALTKVSYYINNK